MSAATKKIGNGEKSFKGRRKKFWRPGTRSPTIGTSQDPDIASTFAP